MTKEKLMEMGLDAEQADGVMAGLDGAYVPKSRFNEVNAGLQAAKAALKEMEGAHAEEILQIKTEFAIAGASPAGGTGTPPDLKISGFENRLMEARKNGNNLEAIKIKQEAAAEGIVLM